MSLVTVQAGDGKTFPQAGQQVTMHYVCKNAKTKEVYDSSIAKNRPFKFTLGAGQVIKGWDIGVAKLSLGEKAVLSVPSALGYGSSGVGPIKGGTDLEFDVELLKIE